MSRGEIQTTWTRFLADETLSSVEEELLLRELATDVAFRRESLDDVWLDTALRQQACQPANRDNFVTNFRSRLRIESASPPSLQTSLTQSELEVPTVSDGFLPTAPWHDASQPLELKLSRAAAKGASWSWRRFAAAGLATAAVLAVGAVIMFMNRGEPQLARKPSRPEEPRIGETPPPKAPGFARLASAPGAVWEKPLVVGDRLEKGPVRLLKGKAKIAFDGGPVVELNGPATLELIDDKHATLKEGKLRTETTSRPTGFTLETPTSRIVDQGAACELAVGDDGATDVCVHQGEVELEQCTKDRFIADRWRIGQGGSKRVSVVGESPIPLPQAGGFKGVLSVNGQTREFTDRAEYELARRETMAQFDRFSKSLLGGLGNLSGPPDPAVPGHIEGGFKGQFHINGQETTFDSPEAFDRARRQAQEQIEQMQKNPPKVPGVPNKPGPLGPQMGGFKGRIFINGQSMEFDNPNTFMEMQRRMMEQFEQFRRQFQPPPPAKR